MRGLAKYVMTGRRQSYTAAVLISAIPPFNIITPSIVALVLLRRGFQEASPLLIAALIAPLMWVMSGQGEPLVIVLMLTVAALAAALREFESWELTLLLAVLCGIGTELFLWTQPAVLNVYMAQMVQMQALFSEGQSTVAVSEDQLPAAFGVMAMVATIVLLMYARSMQAGLYQPGGFRKEFHSLRLNIKSAVGLVLLMLLSNFGLLLPASWGIYGAIALIVAGLALVHGQIARQGLPSSWLFALYGALVALPLTAGLLIVAAVADSRADFRKLG